MMRKLQMFKPPRRFAACAGLAALAVGIVVAWPRETPTVGADIRESPPRETFLSGGARAEIVLREMAETLRRIDGRLERFEQALRDSAERPAEREPPLQDAGQQPGPGPAPAGGNNGDNP
jgi:hypothetical protein